MSCRKSHKLAKITRDSAKITVEQVHGLMSQVTSYFGWILRIALF